MWKTRVTVDNNNKMPKPFLDIAVESDRKTKLHVLFNFEEDNKWELKIDRVPGQKMTIEATIDGQKWTGVGTLNQGDMKLNLKVDSEFTGKHYTLDFDLNPAGMWGIHVTGEVDGPVDAKWTMQKDFTMGEIVVKYKNQNYAFMQLKGNAEMRGMFPVMFDYVVKYNINDAIEHQGKAKMKFDGKTPSKKFEMSFAPKTGTPMDFVWNMDFTSGFKYDYEFKMNAVTMEKGDGEYRAEVHVPYKVHLGLALVLNGIVDVVLHDIVEHYWEHSAHLSVALQLHESVVLVLVLHNNFSHGEVLLHGPLGIHR